MQELILVISAAIANFILGTVWYGVFGKNWSRAWRGEKNIKISKDPIPYLVSFIGSLWASYGLFLMIKHIQPRSMAELLTLAVGTWLLIVVGLASKHYSFAGVPLRKFLMEYGLDLVGITLMSVILSSYL
jgi:hypothetical protein